MQFRILTKEEAVTPGSIRVLLDPSRAVIHPGWIYEIGYYLPSWVPDFVADVVAKIVEWWKENVEGVDIIRWYRDGNNLVFQIRASAEASCRGVRITGITGGILGIIVGLAAILIILGVVFMFFGMRLAGAGMVMLGLSPIIFLITQGYYKLLAAIPFAAGLYLIAKEAGAV